MKQTFRSVSYLIVAFLLVLYGLPRLPIVKGETEAVFSFLWLGFALLIIGAHIYQLISEKSEPGRSSPHLSSREEERMNEKTTQLYY
jgi:hypothetical protein